MPHAMVNMGLRYDVIPPKQSGPTDVERKLAALTEQLENEMRITSSPSSPSVKKDKPPPPPYHGPHHNEVLPRVLPANATTTSPGVPLLKGASPLGGNSPGSPSIKVTSPLRTPLPMQVTPPPRKGPSEAERKIEALTKELESQMERNPQGEYFGEYRFFIEKFPFN